MMQPTDEEARRADLHEDATRFWNVMFPLTVGPVFLLCLVMAVRAGLFQRSR